MRKLLVLLFIFLVLLTPKHAFAHLPGQTPYFKINGKYSSLYPVLTSSLNNFALPQDIGPQTYLINKPIVFEIDTNKLPVPKEILDQTTFTWDFGDGSHGQGLTNTHTYRKMGSYTLSIEAKTPDMPSSQLIQSVMFHVLPDKLI